jgi:2-polyprenyl-3-methyl-5-hydroxy-6-metoxy-1,4-benzoquinol methylase
MLEPPAMRYKNNGNASALALLPRAAERVLDVGCGSGDNARLLRASGHRVSGVTLSAEEAQAAGQFCEHVWVGDVESMPLPSDAGLFDALLMSHVVEHLAKPSATITRLAPLLRPRGWLVVAVPNMAFWRVRWRVLRGDWSYEDTGFFDRTHLHFWTYDTRAEILRDTPFELLAARGADGSAPLRPLRSLLPRLASRLDRMALAASPNLVAGQLLLLARRFA